MRVSARVSRVAAPSSSAGANWLFSETVAGATASPNLYSLIETAKANGIEPRAYLEHLVTHLPSAATVDHFEALLPWNVKRQPSDHEARASRS